MRRFTRITRWIAAPLAALFLATTFNIGAAQAGLVATDTVAQENRIDADRERVMAFVERDDVQQEMVALGVDPDEATARVAAMSDSEIQQVAQKMDQMPAGEGAVGAIVGAALIVFIVLLITDIAGVTNVFSFTK